MQRLMLADLQSHGGQILHLPPFARRRRRLPAQWSLATRTDRWPMLHDVV